MEEFKIPHTEEDIETANIIINKDIDKDVNAFINVEGLTSSLENDDKKDDNLKIKLGLTKNF